ncbi:putative Signal receiver domain REC fused with EAL domain [Vibrio nigripulchritudo MADA3029]|uniref:EAL domain-containing response regulator n=2 Tax=Vibrio nigripulchritudo TaxID=28173 RepID=UPI0003B243FE|nr:EAL domain-containing response regulator [Vibrio nigripulchritudo]CCN50491.1 putative Signal receiver domain REC fused with EAL domain [Vibrio nigripulchritudo MADA3020]CCN52442.1 putative Signal receiver domain REC fused with EAL domain [Vibrio nigripulchritudo MADA3021]CCN62269.1 putative Signal receiver domain REC fused with EAL domain [Vibrio nigripulchritudo MADA3029]
MDRHVLIIEDHDFQRKFLHLQLEKAGLNHISSVSCGTEALEYIGKHHPNLLICDLNMPTMDGVELLQKLGEQNYRGDVIISSAQNEMVINAANKMCIQYGLNLIGQMEKPVTTEKLANLLNQTASLSTSSASSQIEVTEAQIRQAVENNEFELYYQPLVNFKTGDWQESETLIRWNHPDYGVLSPFFFLDKVQQLGLLPTVALQTLNQAIRDLPYTEFRRFAFNITANELMNEQFTNHLLQLIESNTLSPTHVRLELTESDVVQNLGRALASATRICMKGITLAIDDFGTGYSSLKLLEDLPFSELKLDVDFVKNVNHNRSSRAIVEASLFLAEKLGFDTVAEGIEDQKLWATMQSLSEVNGLAQGFFVARPMPVTELEQWHNNWKERIITENLI